MGKATDPVADNKFCFGPWLDLYMQGKHVTVNMMAGNTGDEFPNAFFADSEEEFRKKVKERFGDAADEFFAFPRAKGKWVTRAMPLSMALNVRLSV